MVAPEDRRLAWPDCRNARDLGGLPTRHGRRVRRGALVRSDRLDRLTVPGVHAVRGCGINRIVDLRSVDEAKNASGPFAHDPIYQLHPLIDPDQEFLRDIRVESTPAATYRGSLVRNARHIVSGIAAIADAPPGGVLVHCAAGKDRTGMTVALTLRVAGVPDEEIAADYAFTAVCLREQFEAELAGVIDEAERERLQVQQGSPPEAILGMLEKLDAIYGNVGSYLTVHGMTAAQVERLRSRIVH